MYKAMIVEDSRLARVELKSQLKGIENIELVAEAASLEQAREKLEQHSIDLLFLDVDLPDGNGFELLAELIPAPKVIFTTAFSEYAVDAFEQQAVDYLLKPFTKERLLSAVHRLPSEPVTSSEPETSSEVEPVMQLHDRFFVKDGKRCWLIALEQVERFASQGNYTQVFFEKQKPMLYRTLGQIEQRLPEKDFFRANRSEIVQMAAIENTEFCASGSLVLTLKNGDQVEVSRRQLSKFKQIFVL